MGESSFSWATVTAGEAPVQSPVPRPETSLAAMDSAAQTAGSTRQISSERIDCPRKWVEITLLTASGTPIAGASCRLDLPGSAGREATTNGSGVATFEGISIDPSTATLDIALAQTEETTAYLIRVVPAGAPRQAARAQDAEPPGEDAPVYFRIPWELE